MWLRLQWAIRLKREIEGTQMKQWIKTIPMSAAVILILNANPAFSQGMPAESRENIHALFSNHAKITRVVKSTDTGYIATTESADPKLARVLQEHVRQMSDRLEAGLMVRRWDPAFEEYVAHYDQIQHQFEATAKGVRMTVVGKNPKAIRVAQNHAAVVSDFVENGWKAHDRSHAAVGEVSSGPTKQPKQSAKPQCCSGPDSRSKKGEGGKEKGSCCRKSAR